MKKREFAMLMAAVMAFSLMACGNKADNGSGGAADPAETNKQGVVGPQTGGNANNGQNVPHGIGDALLQKTYTVSILDKKRATNKGNLPKYYVEGSHEAIIAKDIFLRVQAEIARRAHITPDGKKRIYSSRYALSSIVFCGHCGDIYRRIKWNNRGCKSTVWRCVSRVLKKDSGIDCPARTLREEDLHAAVLTAINDA